MKLRWLQLIIMITDDCDDDEDDDGEKRFSLQFKYEN